MVLQEDFRAIFTDLDAKSDKQLIELKLESIDLLLIEAKLRSAGQLIEKSANRQLHESEVL